MTCYFAVQTIDIPPPDKILFFDADIYQWRALDKLSVAAIYCPAYKKAGHKAILIDSGIKISYKSKTKNHG